MILRDISAADPAFGMLREADWAVFNLLLLLKQKKRNNLKPLLIK